MNSESCKVSEGCKMKEERSAIMLQNGLAILLAVRCQQKDAVLQILHRVYHDMPEKDSKTLLNRVIYLMTPKERDWMKNLA